MNVEEIDHQFLVSELTELVNQDSVAKYAWKQIGDCISKYLKRWQAFDGG